MSELTNTAKYLSALAAHRSTMAAKLRQMGKFTSDTEANNAKYNTIANKFSTINVHDCVNYTVGMGDKISIAEGYHKGCTIQVGETSDLEHNYQLIQGGVVTLDDSIITEDKYVDMNNVGVDIDTDDNGMPNYYGIENITIKALGQQYCNVAKLSHEGGETEGVWSSDLIRKGYRAYCNEYDFGTSEGDVDKAILVTGTMPENVGSDDEYLVINPLRVSEITLAEAFYSNNYKIKLASSLDEALAALVDITV